MESPDENVQNNETATPKKLGGCTGKGFLPGQSGNPGGRPKRKPVTELYEEILNDPEAIEMLRQSLIKSLKKGNMAMVLQLKEMTDRVEGKVTQPIEADISVNLADAISAARKRAGK
jgi:hypothetical protein